MTAVREPPQPTHGASSYAARIALATVLLFLAAVWTWAVIRPAVGARSRLALAAVPVLLHCVAIPRLFDRETEPMALWTFLFMGMRLGTPKILAYSARGGGPLAVQPPLGFVHFVAAANCPVLPVDDFEHVDAESNGNRDSSMSSRPPLLNMRKRRIPKHQQPVTAQELRQGVCTKLGVLMLLFQAASMYSIFFQKHPAAGTTGSTVDPAARQLGVGRYTGAAASLLLKHGFLIVVVYCATAALMESVSLMCLWLWPTQTAANRRGRRQPLLLAAPFDQPQLSTSLADFWSRWNRPQAACLRALVYDPMLQLLLRLLSAAERLPLMARAHQPAAAAAAASRHVWLLSRALATLVTFIVSACEHELFLWHCLVSRSRGKCLRTHVRY